MQTMAIIIQVTNNDYRETINNYYNLSSKEISCFKYAPVTEYYVERSFG